MDPQPGISSSPAPPETRMGIVLRVTFFVAAVFIGLRLLSPLLFAIFGTVVAGTVGLLCTGLFANLLTMRIFDRRPLSDIGLGVRHASGWNFLLGVGFAGGAAALMLSAPLLAGTG